MAFLVEPRVVIEVAGIAAVGLAIVEFAPSVGASSALTTVTLGKRIVNIVPLPGVLSTRSSPPSSRAISRLMARPRPVPP